MSRALLDVNLLLALHDSDHIDHERAHAWFGALDSGWATCAITENGFARILSQPRYPSPRSPAEAIETLAVACAREDHEFWSCDLSVLDPAVLDAACVHGPGQVTDAYLLALAVARGGRLVTLDRTVALSSVRGAIPDNLLVL